jgi:flagellin
MSTSVALSIGMRNALFSIGDINTQTAVANKRLATGKKVNDALDNPLNYFLARGFDKNRTDLSNLLDSQNIGLNTLQKAVKAIESISKLVEQVQALARQARQSNDDAANGVRDTLGIQIRDTLNQVSQLTVDAGFNGKNLLKEAPDTLNIDFNAETGVNLTRLTIVGTDLTAYGATLGFGLAAQGLGITPQPAPDTDDITYTAGAWPNDATGNGRLDALILASQNALTRSQAIASSLAVNVSILNVRIDYSKANQRTLATTSDQLTLADVNEEGANLAALQTRSQLAVQALSLANQSDQGILRLF